MKEMNMNHHEPGGLKKNFFRLWILCLAVAGLQTVPSPAHPAGKLIIDPMSFDCGVVDEGVPATMLVRIENAGDVPVLIQNVQTN